MWKWGEGIVCVSLSTVCHRGDKYLLAQEIAPGTHKPMELSVGNLKRRVWENTWSLPESQLPTSLVAFTGGNMIHLFLYEKVSMTVTSQSLSAFPPTWEGGNSFRDFDLPVPAASLVCCEQSWWAAGFNPTQNLCHWPWPEHGGVTEWSLLHSHVFVTENIFSMFHKDQNLGNKQVEDDLNDLRNPDDVTDWDH